MPKRENSSTVYLTVRLDLASDRKLSHDELNDIVGNLDYEFISRTHNVDIDAAEICGVEIAGR